MIPMAVGQNQSIGNKASIPNEVNHGLTFSRIVAGVDGHRPSSTKNNTVFPFNHLMIDAKNAGDDFGEHGASIPSEELSHLFHKSNYRPFADIAQLLVEGQHGLIDRVVLGP
jgi:hypothetical protein